MKDKIDINRLPKHIAIIMDGNGRWAKTQNQPRIFGHQHGVNAVRESTEACAELGIKFLTLYAFSTENWNRPITEVDALMSLLIETIHQEIPTLNKNKVRLKAIGDLSKLPEGTKKALKEAIALTDQNDRMDLVLALNYSGRWDIAQAAKRVAEDVKKGMLDPEQLDEHKFASYLNTNGIPDPELLIRTSGESRVSNFLLWEIAYAELLFLPVFWPEFNKEHIYEAIINFQNRERRFGKISEQLNS
ncbi:MAG: isoprenyl transferase [Saprospiraceae bacterium]|nr:isoprenyl transferase [Saprospiraceae bacterium]